MKNDNQHFLICKCDIFEISGTAGIKANIKTLALTSYQYSNKATQISLPLAIIHCSEFQRLNNLNF
jgi:hypothetical protein